MALFVVRTEDRPEVVRWYSQTVRRGMDESLVRNPFKWRWKSFRRDGLLLLVCDAEPVIPPFYIFAWLAALAIFLIWGVSWVVWLFVGIGMLGYFWTATFFYHMAWLVLRRKAGYRGKIKRVKLSELVREVVL